MRLRIISTIAVLTVAVFSHPAAQAQRLVTKLSLASTATVEIREGENRSLRLNFDPFPLRNLNVFSALIAADGSSRTYTLLIDEDGETEGVDIPLNHPGLFPDDEEIAPPRETFTFQLFEGDHYVLAGPTSVTIIVKEGVCDRSRWIRDALVGEVESSVTDTANPRPGDAISNFDDDECFDVTEAHLGTITSLNLPSAQITELKERDFLNLEALTTLDLSGNQLSELPENVFSPLVSLKTLRLNENNLTTLPASVFSFLNSLETLRLNRNNLTTLSASVFSDLGKLRVLNLHLNRLSRLPWNVFSSLASLEELSLNENNLTALPQRIFAGLSNLRSLRLESNDLTALPERVFAGLSSLRSLRLESNSFAGSGEAVLTLDFVKHDPPDDASPFDVFASLRLREGAPFNMQIALRAEGVSLSPGQATLAAGDVHSNIFAVTQTQAGATVTFAAPQLPNNLFCGRPAQRCYLGFNIAAGEPFDPAASPPPFPRPSLSLIPGTVEAEEGSTAEITINVSPFAPRNVTVHYTVGAAGDTAEDDYLDPHPGGVVTIPKGAVTGTIRIVVLDDVEIEPARERFTVSLIESADYALASSSIAQVVVKEGVCDRSAPLRDALTDEAGASVPGAGCSDVTEAHLNAVTDLNLSSANLTALKQKDFLSLGALSTLNLSRNRLSELPENVFSPLVSLETLSLNGNALVELPAGVFSSLISLESLFLNENALNELPTDAFSSLISLESLFLNENALNELPAGVFSGLGKLRILNLHDNQLMELPRGVFLSLISLEELTLSTNRLTALPERVFAGLHKLQSLWLGGNSFDEDGEAVLTLGFSHRGADESGNNVRARLTLREGAPFDMHIMLQAEGSTLSSTEVTLATGDEHSNIFTVTQIADVATVALTAPPLPDDDCERTQQRCYQGFRIVAGEPFDPAAPPPSSRLRIRVFLEGALE